MTVSWALTFGLVCDRCRHLVATDKHYTIAAGRRTSKKQATTDRACLDTQELVTGKKVATTCDSIAAVIDVADSIGVLSSPLCGAHNEMCLSAGCPAP